MLKLRTGTDWSDQTTTFVSTAEAAELLIEKRVFTPSALSRSTSKYGNIRVAAGTLSIVPIVAAAGPARASRPARAIPGLLLMRLTSLGESCCWTTPLCYHGIFLWKPDRDPEIAWPHMAPGRGLDRGLVERGQLGLALPGIVQRQAVVLGLDEDVGPLAGGLAPER